MPWLLIVPALFFTVVVHVAAPGAGAWYAFTSWNGLGHATWIGLGNFREIFKTPTTRNALYHTLEIAGSFVAVVNLIGLSLALALNRVLRTRHLLRAVFFLPAVMSPVAVAYIWQFVFDYYGPLNRFLGAVGLSSWKHVWLGDPNWALWMVLVVLVWQFSGLVMVLYLAGLQSIPDELFEASLVDGASAWMRFRRVTFPLLAPAFTVATTLMLIFGLRVFDQILALTNGGPVDATESLSTQVWKQTFVNSRFGYGAALALILTALIALMAITQVVLLRRREARI